MPPELAVADPAVTTNRKDMMTRFEHAAEMAELELADIISRQTLPDQSHVQSAGSWAWCEVYRKDTFQILRAWDADGKEGPMGTHMHPESDEQFVIVKGGIRVISESGRTRTLMYGMTYRVHAGERHTIAPLAGAEVVVICVPPVKAYEQDD